MNYLSAVTVGLAAWCIGLASSGMYPNAIIQVQPECAATTDSATRVTLTSDAPVFYGYAKCQSGYTFNFTEVDMANQELFAHYSGDTDRRCVFDKKQRSRTYTLQVFVVVGTDNGVLMDEQFYLITCTYDPHASEESGVKDFGKGLNPAQEVTVNKGGEAKSTIDLAAVDILGNPIPGSLILGSMMKLRATMTESAKGETSFHPLTCKASAPGVEYPLLVAGCGDGRVLPASEGFTTRGKVAFSPVFKTFRLKDARSLTFTCTYYICSGKCDGNSCMSKKAARHRRDLKKLQLETAASQPEELSNDIMGSGSVVKGVYSSSVQYYIHDHDIGQVVFAEDGGSGDLENLLGLSEPSHLQKQDSDAASGDVTSQGLLVAVCITSTLAVASICAIVYLLYRTKTIIDQDGSLAGSGVSVRSYSTTSVRNEHFLPSSCASLASQNI